MSRALPQDTAISVTMGGFKVSLLVYEQCNGTHMSYIAKLPGYRMLNFTSEMHTPLFMVRTITVGLLFIRIRGIPFYILIHFDGLDHCMCHCNEPIYLNVCVF